MFLPAARRDDGAELQSLVSISNIPDLNPKSLRSGYVMKAYELLTAIHLSDRDVKPGDPLGLIEKIG